MTLASVDEALAGTVLGGSLLLALPIAALAGLVSFLSPCVLPLVPGYLSYVTGLSGVELGTDFSRGGSGRRARLLAGCLLFVLGFTVVFVSYGAVFGGAGALLQAHARIITGVLGAVTIALGLAFAGLLPGLHRDIRLHYIPAAGLVGAPLLGVLFGVGWTPCIGPTLAAVQTLAFSSASAARGAILSAAYCLGLGLPFVFAALAFRRALATFGVVKRHYVWVMRAGGAMLVVIGVLLVAGLWSDLTVAMRAWTSGFRTVI